jgi:hypothetical protein
MRGEAQLASDIRAMDNLRDHHPLRAGINRKLAEIVRAATPPPAWSDAWLRMGPETSAEERLAVYQAIRDSGSVPPDAGFFLVAWQIDDMTSADTSEDLHQAEDHLEAVRRDLNISEDELLAPEEEPHELKEAQARVAEAMDVLCAAKMAEFGEAEMARLFQADETEFARRRETGRIFFHGPRLSSDVDDSFWLDDLKAAVAECIEPDSPMGPLGLRYREEEGFWEITIFATPVELVGGADDGEIVLSGFSVDLERFRGVFDSIADFGWDASGVTGEEGPYVWVEGIFQGREVYLQVLATAPDDEEPGLKVDATHRP